MKTLNLSPAEGASRMRRGFPLLPEMPLPFYPRSGGWTALAPGSREVDRGEHKPFVQLSWILAGSGSMLTGNLMELVSSGDVVFQYPREDRRNLAAETGLRIRWLTFDGSGAAGFLRSYGYPRVVRAAGECPEELFCRFEDCLEEESSFAVRRALGLIVEILALAGGTRPEKSAESPWVRRFQNAAERYYMEPSTDVNMLCSLLKVHRGTVARAFREAGGGSPGEYLRELRLRHALELLTSGIGVAQTASRCGFWNASYFTQTVRRLTGFTPGHFRKFRQ